MQKRALIGTILVLIALVMIMSSLFMPWYKIEMSVSGLGLSTVATIEYYLDHNVTEMKSDFIGDAKIETSYSNERLRETKAAQTFKTTQTLVYLGIIGCIFGLIGTVMVMLNKIGRGMGTLLVIIALILSIFAPLYLMFTLPNAFSEDSLAESESSTQSSVEEDFFGSEKYEALGVSAEISWGPAIGWFLALFAMLLCIPSLFLVIISSPTPRKAYEAKPLKWDMFEEQGTYKSYNVEKEAQESSYLTKDLYLKDYPTRDQQIEGYQEEEVQSPKVFQPLIPPPPQGYPAGQYKNTRFKCPDCGKIVIVNVPKRPLAVVCNSCRLKGIVE